MHLFTNKVIPIDAMLAGKKISLPKIVEDAKLYPWHFAGELFCLVMMIVGVYVFADYAYEIGRIVGRSL